MRTREGQVDTRMLQNGKARLRFRLHAEPYANVRLALDTVKAQTGTKFDEVALDAICTFYLTHYPMKDER